MDQAASYSPPTPTPTPSQDQFPWVKLAFVNHITLHALLTNSYTKATSGMTLDKLK